MQWIPIDESLPGNDRRVLLSFENCQRIVIGWYEVDDMTGGYCHAALLVCMSYAISP